MDVSRFVLAAFVVVALAPQANAQSKATVCVWEIWAAPVKFTYEISGTFQVSDPARAAATCVWETRYEYHAGLTTFSIPFRQASGRIVVSLVRVEGTNPAALDVSGGRLLRADLQGSQIRAESEFSGRVPPASVSATRTTHVLPVAFEAAGPLVLATTPGGELPPSGGGTTGGAMVQASFGGAPGQCGQNAVYYDAQHRAVYGWQSSGAAFAGTSDVRNMVNGYVFCTYTLPRAAKTVTLGFRGGRVTIDPQQVAMNASGGGLSLLVYAGGASPAGATGWGNSGGHLWSQDWSLRPDWNRDLPSQTFTVALPPQTTRVTIGLLVTDAWEALPVQVNVNGLDVTVSD